MDYPLLLPALRRLWRDHRTLQLGVDPGNAVILEFADRAVVRLLDLLDGTRAPDTVASAAAELGVPVAAVRRFIGSLRAAGLVVDAASLLPDQLRPGTRRRLAPEAAALSLRERPGGRTPARVLARRRRSRILVTGRGRLIAPIAALLAASGVGSVHPAIEGTVSDSDTTVGGLLVADAHRPRRVAGVEAVHRAAPDTDTRPLDERTADLVVLVGMSRPPNLTALSLALRRTAHLAVWLRDGTVVVGPLVRPGVPPCLQCVDAHRQALDPDWPALAAQLATAPDQPEPCEATVAVAGAALVAAEALREVDGGSPRTLGGTLELSGPDLVRRRSWPEYPGCGCADNRGKAPTIAPEPTGHA